MSSTTCRAEFSTLVSYRCFVELMPTLLVPLLAYLHSQLGRCTGISFIDSTSLALCHNPRLHQHQVFAQQAARGKTSVGWFYGFKLHLVTRGHGDLLTFCLALGKVDDRRPVPKLLKGLFGKLFFLVNLVAGLMAYWHQPKKSSLGLQPLAL